MNVSKRGVLAGLFCLLAGAGTIAAAGDVVVDDADQNRTYDCAGGNAVVNTGDNVLVFKNCVSVVVNGGDNQIDAGTASTITVHGSDNKVTYTEAAGGRRPKIVNMGTKNVISSGTGKAAAKSASRNDDDDEHLGADVAELNRALAASGGRVTLSGDGTMRVEGSKGGTVELGANGITARASRDFVVSENNRNEALDCAGGSAAVDGNNSVLKIRDCRTVSVSGNGNKLDVVGAREISIVGNANDVGWSGDAPKISDVGKKNTVTRRP